MVMVDRLASVLQDLAQCGELVKAVDKLQQSARSSDNDADKRMEIGAGQLSKPVFMVSVVLFLSQKKEFKFCTRSLTVTILIT